MSNLILGWPNRIDDATLTGGSWRAGLTLANLQNRRMSSVARSTTDATADTKFLADLGQSRSLRVVALVNHNLSIDATWRITLGTSSGGSQVYDSGWQGAWAMTFDSEMLEWEADNWWAGIADDEYVRHPFNIVWPFDAYYSARYVTIEIDDTTNPDGYVQIARPFVGGGLQPVTNASFGASDGWVDPSGIEAAISGAEFFDMRQRYRAARFALEWLDNEDFKRAFELQRRLGTTGEVLYVPDPADLDACQRRGFLGRLRELSPIEYPRLSIRSAAFELKELL